MFRTRVVRVVNENFLLNRMISKIKAVLNRVGTLLTYFRYYGQVKRAAGLSMLSPLNMAKYRLEQCSICGSGDYQPLIEFPVGYPEGQGHSLMYFDYGSADMATVYAMKETLDRTLGFALSVPWRFCNQCKNGSLAIEMTQEHLNGFYSQHYKRSQAHHPLRKVTKELHGRYLCKFLQPGSTVLEIGAAEGYASGYVASQGHHVSAFEPSTEYWSNLEQLAGVTVETDFASLQNREFDAVFLHHVLEHIAAPLEYAKLLYSMVKPGGLLFVQVPDLDPQVEQYSRGLKRSPYSLLNRPVVSKKRIEYDFWCSKNAVDWIEALLNDHVSAFTPKGLTYVMEESGFTVEQLSQSTADTVTSDPGRFSWPVDVTTGNTPNSISLIARKT